MNKVTVVEVQVGVSVKGDEDPTAVLTRVSTAAQALKKELGEVEVFSVASREVPVQEQPAPDPAQQ